MNNFAIYLTPSLVLSRYKGFVFFVSLGENAYVRGVVFGPVMPQSVQFLDGLAWKD